MASSKLLKIQNMNVEIFQQVTPSDRGSPVLLSIPSQFPVGLDVLWRL